MSYDLRAATVDDLAAITELEALCFDDPWSEGAVASHLASKTGVAFLAVSHDGVPLGYILGMCAGDEAELLRVGVHPEHRALRIGRNLVDYFLFRLIPLGTKTCYLEVRASNSIAQNLYTSHSFREIGVRKRYYKNPTEDAILMAYHFEE